MTTRARKHVLILHNPGAGDQHPSAEELVRAVRARGYDVSYRPAKPRSQAVRGEPAPDLVLLAGGDGTVGKLALRRDWGPVPLGVLPIGTANNIAAALGLRDCSLDELLSLWERGELRRIDVGHVAGRWGSHRFLEGTGVGLIAAMGEIDAEKKRVTEPLQSAAAELSYDRTALARLARRTRCWVEVKADGRIAFRGDALLVEVLNTRSIGPGLLLAPSADAGDGWLDLAYTEARDAERLIADLERSGRAPGTGLLFGPGLGEAARAGEYARVLELRWARGPLHVDGATIAWEDASPAEGAHGAARVTLEPGTLTFVARDV